MQGEPKIGPVFNSPPPPTDRSKAPENRKDVTRVYDDTERRSTYRTVQFFI